eukprot:superscaffoldBa00009843_g24342
MAFIPIMSFSPPKLPDTCNSSTRARTGDHWILNCTAEALQLAHLSAATLCSAPSHLATACTLSAPLPHTSVAEKRNLAVLRSLPLAVPPPSITPKPAIIQPLALSPKNHPDQVFVNFFIKGFRHSFHRGLQVMPISTYICHNLQSALSDTDKVDKLLQKEVDDVFMIGPFSSPPFPSFRVSPIGVATRKHSGKKTLIIDLSSPYSSAILSINSLIPSPYLSMQYATIDHAISLSCLASLGSWLSKAGSSFKVCPPEIWLT